MLRPVGLFISLYFAVENINCEDNITVACHIKNETSVLSSDSGHTNQRLVKRFIFTLVSKPISVSDQINISDYNTFKIKNNSSVQDTILQIMAGKQLNKVGMQPSINNSISNIDSKKLNNTDADKVLGCVTTGKTNSTSDVESTPKEEKSTENEVDQKKSGTDEIELVNRSFIDGETCPTGYIRVDGKCIKAV